jgi:UDP-galactose transporter B1
MVFVQCVINAVFAQVAIGVSNAGVDNSPQHLYAIMSFSYVGAMLASNEALQYVSYPTQVLGKSIKPIPVMILGVFLARKRYPMLKYLFVLMIVMGVALFMYKPKSSHKSLDQDHVLGFGEVLLMVSLLLDGVTGGVQDKIRAQHRTQTHRMMLWMNLWSIFYLFLGLLATGEGLEFLSFSFKYPWVIVQLVLFSLCSAIGQNFIFMTITNFGPLPCSIITTTRKFFTILASVLIFQHPMSPLQWVGTIFVFAGLSLDSTYGKERKPVKH